MLNNNSEGKDLATRLELRDEILVSIGAGHKKELNKLHNKIESLIKEKTNTDIDTAKQQSELDTIKQSSYKLNIEHLKLQKELREAKTKNVQLEKTIKKNSTATKQLKEEVKSLQDLNPKVLKKRLDKTKKDLESKVSANEILTSRLNKEKEKNSTISSILSAKKNKEKETVSDYTIYTSKCGHFNIFGAAFKSESHPFTGNEINFRVIDLRCGTSVIAQYQDGEVCFSKQNKIPQDVIDALKTNIISAQKPVTNKKS